MRLLPLVVASFLLIVALPLRADTIDLVNDQNGTFDDWTTATDWSNDQSPSAGNNYVVNFMTLRANAIYGGAQYSVAVFGGGSLAINNGTLNLNSEAYSQLEFDIAQLSISNATFSSNIYSSLGSPLIYVNNLTINGSNTFMCTGELIANSISGSGTLTFEGNPSVTNSFSGDASNFTGTVATDNLTNFLLGLTNAENMTLDLGSSLENVYIQPAGVTVAHLNLFGTELNPGTYTASDLNTMLDEGSIFNGGDITVVPEPAPIALLSLALGALLLPATRRLRLA